MAMNLKQALIDELRALMKLPIDDLLERRAERMRGYGFFDVVAEPQTAADPKDIEDALELRDEGSSQKLGKSKD